MGQIYKNLADLSCFSRKNSLSRQKLQKFLNFPYVTGFCRVFMQHVYFFIWKFEGFFTVTTLFLLTALKMDHLQSKKIDAQLNKTGS